MLAHLSMEEAADRASTLVREDHVRAALAARGIPDSELRPAAGDAQRNGRANLFERLFMRLRRAGLMRRNPDFQESADMRLVELQRAALGVPAPARGVWESNIAAEGTVVDPEGPQHPQSAVIAVEASATPSLDVIPGAIVTVALSLVNEGVALRTAFVWRSRSREAQRIATDRLCAMGARFWMTQPKNFSGPVRSSKRSRRNRA